MLGITLKYFSQFLFFECYLFHQEPVSRVLHSIYKVHNFTIDNLFLTLVKLISKTSGVDQG